MKRVAPSRADEVKTVIAAAQNSPTAAFVRALPFHARLLLAAEASTRSAGVMCAPLPSLTRHSANMNFASVQL